jgi:endonuclease/exonuclease/phosphatase family metal-dependent hydrolase
MNSSRLSSFLLVIGVALGSFLLLHVLCQPKQEVSTLPPSLPAVSSASSPIEKRELRIATYNVTFLSEREPQERLENLRSVIRNLQPDILALQEVQSLQALRALLRDEWEIAIQDNPGERQEVALAVRKPLTLARWEFLFSGKEFDDAFPGGRDVLRAVVTPPKGPDIVVYVVHLKSRSGGRRLTDHQRIMACALLAGYIRAKNEPYAILLGDFNDSPDDTSLNILETGDLLTKGRMENDPDHFLINLCEPLWAKDYVSFGAYLLPRGKPFVPKVQGARKENDRWRDKDYRYPDDLSIIQILFDQILVTPALAKSVKKPAQVYAGEDALKGTPSKRETPGTLASDHLPVYVDLDFP